MFRIIITMATKTKIVHRRHFSSTPTKFECRTKNFFRSKTEKKSEIKTNCAISGRRRNRMIPAGTMTSLHGNLHPSGLWNVVIINLKTMWTLKWQLFSLPFLGTDINDVTTFWKWHYNLPEDGPNDSSINLTVTWRKWRHNLKYYSDVTVWWDKNAKLIKWRKSVIFNTLSKSGQ